VSKEAILSAENSETFGRSGLRPKPRRENSQRLADP